MHTKYGTDKKKLGIIIVIFGSIDNYNDIYVTYSCNSLNPIIFLIFCILFIINFSGSGDAYVIGRLYYVLR